MNSNFKVGDIIVPSDRISTEDLRREILSVGDTFYTLKFLSGKQLVVKWPIHGVDGDHRLSYVRRCSMADQMDMIQLAVRETIKNELKLKVEREPDIESQSFSVHLELDGEVIPDSYVVLSLNAGIHNDDIEFEVT